MCAPQRGRRIEKNNSLPEFRIFPFCFQSPLGRTHRCRPYKKEFIFLANYGGQIKRPKLAPFSTAQLAPNGTRIRKWCGLKQPMVRHFAILLAVFDNISFLVQTPELITSRMAKCRTIGYFKSLTERHQTLPPHFKILFSESGVGIRIER